MSGAGELLAALPLILLLLALACKRYPGERFIARLCERFRQPRPRPASSAAPSGVPRRWPHPALAALAATRPLRGPPAPFRFST